MPKKLKKVVGGTLENDCNVDIWAMAIELAFPVQAKSKNATIGQVVPEDPPLWWFTCSIGINPKRSIPAKAIIISEAIYFILFSTNKRKDTHHFARGGYFFTVFHLM